MPREISEFTGVVINPLISPCAHTCRYCSIGARKYSSISASRLIALYKRFLEWKAKHRNEDYWIGWGFFGPSYNHDVPTLLEYKDFERQLHGQRWGRIPLGGLDMRPEAEMREWLRERRDLGFESPGVAASMVGHGAIHDKWNGRKGDFQFMMMTQRLAAELGMEVHQGFFVIKDTLPILDEAIEILDAHIGPATQRYARVFLTAGYGASHEDQRITESDLPRIPEWVMELLDHKADPKYKLALRSERQWIAWLKAQKPKEQRQAHLYLNLDDTNIDRIEGMSCDEIIADLEARSREVWSVLPTSAELPEESGDPDSTRIYDGLFDLERVWLDRYIEKHGLKQDWTLLWDYVGKARSPQPPLLSVSKVA
jgi:hypothetical protein